MITLSFEEVKELQDYALEMPGKYGISIINFFNQKLALAQQESEAAKNIEVKNPKQLKPEKQNKSING